MATVDDLIPGQVIDIMGDQATFITQTEHPTYAGLRLVVWRLADGLSSFDALDPRQYVGEAVPSTGIDRMANLRAAIEGTT